MVAQKSFEKHNKIGMDFLQKGNLAEALCSFKESSKIQGNFEASAYQAIVYETAGELEPTIQAAEASLKYNNSVPFIYKILGTAFYKLQRWQESYNSFLKALELDPKLDLCNFYLGDIEAKQRKYFKAVERFKKELEISPNIPTIHNALGNSLIQLGFSTEAVKHYAHGTKAQPSIRAYNFLVYMMAHDPNSSEEDVYKTTIEAYNTVYKPIKDGIPKDFFKKAPPQLNINKRLKIGLVSPNFKGGSAEIWIRNILKNMSKEFDLYFYNYSPIEDEITEAYFKPVAFKWTNISKISDADAAQEIRNDQVDILIDLYGLVIGNRIPIFLYQAAPIQVSWLHYFATTGLPEMDYVIADNNVVPPESEQYFTEKVFKMPNFFHIFNPQDSAHKIELNLELPYRRNGFITFGNFGRFHKVDKEVLETWAKVLKRVENSKLILSNEAIKDADLQNYILNSFESQGVTKDRIEFHPYPATLEDFLKKHHEVDIILDSFPFSGATTLLDASWMGVPTIMLRSERWIGRGPSSYLEPISENLTSKTTVEYIENAISLAKDPNKIQYYRENLRKDMLNSDICNEEKFSAEAIKTFKTIWQKKCTE